MIDGRTIGQYSGAAAPAFARTSAPAAAQDGPTQEQSKAVVQVLPPRPREAAPGASLRASAAFVAQLIATNGDFPQTRERRRAEPIDANAAYLKAARLVRRRH
jgi:hypothetical protein